MIKSCLLGFLLLISHFTAQKNLIKNGGFEDDLYGWENSGGAKATPWDVKAGKYSCAIISQKITNWTGINQTADIPKKTQAIEFSAWVKSVNVVKGVNDWDGAIFTVVFMNSSDKQLGDGVNIVTLTGDQDWQFVKKPLDIPPGAVSFKILLALGNSSGTMLIDDVSAKAIGSAGAAATN